MKEHLQDIALAVIFAVILPQLVVAMAVMRYHDGKTPESTKLPETTTAQQPGMTVNVLTDDRVREMTMEDYLTGVILQELPASFSLEAKKAQAVVARTYALRRCASDKHSGAVCTASSCCQAYIDPSLYLANGGEQAAVDQAREAVEQTAELVLTYQGGLIEATYFSCSGGRTEDAVAVWGSDIPYLQSVESPGEEGAAHYVDSVTFSKGEFAAALNVNTDFGIGRIERTAGGGVASIEVGDKTFTGVQMRQLLALRSTSFTITQLGDSVTVTTRGFGHRVGMSQYGADAMACNGSGFREILAHYYPGTELTQWTDS